MRQLVRQVEEAGLTVRFSRSGHLKVYRGEEFITTLATSPSKRRHLQEARACLRRAGVTLGLKRQPTKTKKTNQEGARDD